MDQLMGQLWWNNNKVVPLNIPKEMFSYISLLYKVCCSHVLFLPDCINSCNLNNNLAALWSERPHLHLFHVTHLEKRLLQKCCNHQRCHFPDNLSLINEPQERELWLVCVCLRLCGREKKGKVERRVRNSELKAPQFELDMRQERPGTKQRSGGSTKQASVTAHVKC